MLNQDKYRTAEERVRAFNAWCLRTTCDKCDKPKNMSCGIYWLALEADAEKPEPCPSCHSDNILYCLKSAAGSYYCECGGCGLRSSMCDTPEAAKDSYNKLARVVRTAKESEKGEVK